MANGDISKFDTIMNYNIFDVFLELNMRADYNKMQKRMSEIKDLTSKNK